jgi:predicted dehydrogenase
LTAKRLLIVGFGSVGRRHAANFHAAGCRVSCADRRDDRRGEALESISLQGRFSNLPDALAASQYDGAVVATPTAYHVEQTCELLSRGIPVLLEKPISVDLPSALMLDKAAKRHGVPLLLGYTWRWWPPLHRLREMLHSGAIGRPLRADFWMSAHLADWHPWEPLADFFMSSKALGGGALLDESHWIDLLIWFFGVPDAVFGRIERISDLPIETDDNVDLLIRYDSGLRATVHLDLIGRPHEKTIRIVGSGGTLVWSAEPNRIRFSNGAAQDWQDTLFTCQRNDMFMALAQDFIAVMNGQDSSYPWDEGMATMRVIEASRRSHISGREVPLKDI